MPFGRASARARYLLSGLSLAAVWLAAGCAPPQVAPQTSVFPATEAARMIHDLYVWIFWMSVLVFIGVQGGLLYIVWRFRYRQGHALPEQVHGNTRMEIMWTILPAIILVMIAFPTIFTVFSLDRDPAADPVTVEFAGFRFWPTVEVAGLRLWPMRSGSTARAEGPPLTVEVIAHQWWWELRYPEQGIVTANELIVPTGRSVQLRMTSADVVHSFWIPQLMGKQDVMPVHINTISFTPEIPGQYWGQCAEYCGLQHANMRMNAIVYTPADFEAWVALNRQPAQPQPATELALQGGEVFGRSACIGCHTISGTTAQAQIGPDLSHFGSRTTLASGILPNTPENLADWLRDPQAAKPGNLMPNLHLRPTEVEALVEYLHSLK